MTAISLIQPVGDSIAPGLMIMCAGVIAVFPIVGVVARWVIQAIGARF
jgi:hypothetical protein